MRARYCTGLCPFSHSLIRIIQVSIPGSSRTTFFVSIMSLFEGRHIPGMYEVTSLEARFFVHTFRRNGVQGLSPRGMYEKSSVQVSLLVHTGYVHPGTRDPEGHRPPVQPSGVPGSWMHRRAMVSYQVFDTQRTTISYNHLNLPAKVSQNGNDFAK